MLNNINIKDNRLSYFISFIVFVIFFIVSKAEYLSLPFYWDEAWVYGNAVVEFSNGNIPWLPTQEYLDLTRGHPLFFYILFSIWGNFFGTSATSFHFLPLLITVLFFIFSFFSFQKFFKNDLSLIAIVLLIGNEIFFTQSSLVLPEVTLGILLLISFYHFINRNWVYYVFFFSLALYTKESALVLFPAIFLVSVYRNFILKESHIFTKEIIIVVVPIILFSLHFIYQKIVFGWYFYPEHIDFIKLDYNSISDRFSGYMKNIFVFRYQFVFSFCFTMSIIYLVWKNVLLSSLIKRILLVLLTMSSLSCMYCFISNEKLFISGSFWLLSVGLALLNVKYQSDKHKIFISGSWLFVSGFILFSALNFYSVRYVISVIIFYSIVQAFCFQQIIEKFNVNFFIVLIIFFVILLIGKNQKKTFEDVDTSYKYPIKIHQEIVDYMVKNANVNDYIQADFLERIALSNSNARYIISENVFKNFDSPNGNIEAYKIITNLAGDIELKRSKIDLGKWNKVKEFKISKSEGEIYKAIE